jgi:hypothetical protein
MAKAAKSVAKAAAVTGTTIESSAFEIVKTFCEKAMGHGLVATEDEKNTIDNALEEIQTALGE